MKLTIVPRLDLCPYTLYNTKSSLSIKNFLFYAFFFLTLLNFIFFLIITQILTSKKFVFVVNLDYGENDHNNESISSSGYEKINSIFYIYIRLWMTITLADNCSFILLLLSINICQINFTFNFYFEPCHS